MTPRRTLAPVVALVLITLGACSSSAKKSLDPVPVASSTGAGPQTLVQTAAYDASLSTFATASNVGGLNGTVSARGPFTVFAPNNDAFARLPRGRLASLLAPAGKQQLVRILTYHVVKGSLRASDLKPGTLTTVNGAKITVAVEGGSVVLTDGRGNKARVVRTDVTASNGIIHIIDGVLLPPR